MTLVQMSAEPPPVNREELRRRLAADLEGEVRFDTLTRALYATDASVYQIVPTGVVIPKSREDILRALTICRRFRCPITMRGGGTSQAGQAIGEGLQIDISKYYNRLLEVNAAERWVRVEPGIVLDELNAQLPPLGLRFAPDISTASRATIGGMMANNSSGARSVLYGKTIDHVLEQTVALVDGSVVEFREISRAEVPEGNSLEAKCYRTVLGLAQTHAAEIERRYPKVLRRVGGYNLDEFTDRSQPVNLAKMMVGSEGTLGIVLEAKLRLVPLPKAKAVMVILFDDLLEALAATPVILGHKPSAVEVMDKSILDHARGNVALESIRSRFLPAIRRRRCAWSSTRTRKKICRRDWRRSSRTCATRRLGYDYRPKRIPKNRRSLEPARGGAGPFDGDEGRRQIDFVRRRHRGGAGKAERLHRTVFGDRAPHETTAGIYAHASVGCLHVRPVINMKTEEGVRKFEAIAKDVADLVLRFGGALSAEHGDGLVRSPFHAADVRPVLYEAFRRDEANLRSARAFSIPGKIVDAPPITSNLRFGAGYETPNPPTCFDYSEYGGMGGAVEMCSGVGACRKKLSGTMCPSLHGDARGIAFHARPRQRAAAGDDRPAGRDRTGRRRRAQGARSLPGMPRLQSRMPGGRGHGAVQERISGGILEPSRNAAAGARLGRPGPMGGTGAAGSLLSNWVRETGLAKRLSETMLGIDRRRTLPAWRRDTFARRLAANGRREPAGGKTVTLFNDTFTNHYDPEIGIAAVEILERGGCAVSVVRPGCCGRPLISQGLLAEASAHGERMVAGLFPIAERGEKILFCEPSCLSAVKEDAPSLLRGEISGKRARLPTPVMLFEEFAAVCDLPLRAARANPAARALSSEIDGHAAGHDALLSRIPGATVVDLDAGCCGMAGSFGYTRSITMFRSRLRTGGCCLRRGTWRRETSWWPPALPAGIRFAISETERPCIRPFCFAAC